MTAQDLLKTLADYDPECTVETIPRKENQVTTVGWYEPANGEGLPSGGDGPVRGMHGLFIYSPLQSDK